VTQLFPRRTYARLFATDPALAARKLSRRVPTTESKAMAVALAAWHGMPDEALVALVHQFGFEAPPWPGVVPPKVRRVTVLVEAAARDALALVADVAPVEPTVADACEAIAERVRARRWALGLATIAKALDPDPDRDLRNTIRSWRDKLPEYSALVIVVAQAMVPLFLGEVLPDVTVSADVLLEFVDCAVASDLEGETLTEAVLGGVGASGSPTFPAPEEATMVRDTKPERVFRAA
jgi:hypothetical protein